MTMWTVAVAIAGDDDGDDSSDDNAFAPFGHTGTAGEAPKWEALVANASSRTRLASKTLHKWREKTSCQH